MWAVCYPCFCRAGNEACATTPTVTGPPLGKQPSKKERKAKALSPELSAQTEQANALMERVFSYVESNDLDSVQYTSDMYLRHHMYTKRKGPFVRYIPGMLRLERGTNSYLSEARLRFQYRQPGQIDCKVVAYHSTARYQQPQRFTSMERFNFQIYDSKLFLDCILNPLHRRNRRFYNYTCLFTSQPHAEASPTARIRIRPRFSNDQLVEGEISIDPLSGAVRHFTFKFRYQMRHIVLTADMGEDGYASLLPHRLHMVSKFNLFGNRVYEATDIHSYHTFSCPVTSNTKKQSRFDLTDQCLLRIDTARIITQRAYFDSIRPYPLNEVERHMLQESFAKKKQTYHSFSKQYAPPADTARKPLPPPPDIPLPPQANSGRELKEEKEGHTFLSERTQNLLLSSHLFNLGKRSRIKLPAIITPSMVGWSRTKGVSLKARAKWELYGASPSSLPVMEFSPSIGYSFKQKQIYWKIPYLLRLLPAYNGLFSFNAGGGDHMYNSRQADELRHKLEGIEKYDSLMHVIDHYGFHDYRDTHIQTDFSLSPRPGLRLTLGARYHRRALIEWNEMAAASGMKRHFSNIGPRLQVEWTPAQYYYREGKRRIPLYSPCPTFLFSYERGYALGRGQTHYERFEADVRYRLPLYAMRTLYFRAGGGTYTQRGLDCFLDYDYFKFSYMPEDWDDDLTGEFQLLSSRWYNESRYYLRFTGTYESPMLLFSRIPYLSKVVQKERVYMNLLSVRALGFYTEMGYGISTHLFDFGAFAGIAPDHSLDFGCKIALKLFDK